MSTTLEEKRSHLLNLLSGYGRLAVAFSAGVDSTVVAMAARLACGDGAVAVTAVSNSLAEGEVEQAVQLARQIGIRHEVIYTSEFSDPDYVKNAPDRCYYCKSELYEHIDHIRERLNVDVVVNGANVDDRGDHRPGMVAAREHAVRSPLLEAGLTKADVRQLAQGWNLPVWDKPASPCLSSRIAYGVEVTPERVQRVDQAEQFLRRTLNIRELRVRHEGNDLARIEIPIGQLPALMGADVRRAIVDRLRSLGFKYVTIDLEGFRSGSMNAVIPVSELKPISRTDDGRA